MSYDHLARAEFQMGKSDEGAMTVYLNNMTLACLVVKLLVILSLFVPTAYPQACGLCLASRGSAYLQTVTRSMGKRCHASK